MNVLTSAVNMILRWIFACYIVQFVVAVQTQDKCINCVPVAECVVYGNLTRAEQQRWATDFSCSPPKVTNNAPSGFASYAKIDFICCPHTNTDKSKNRGRFETHMARSTISKYNIRSAATTQNPNPNKDDNQRQSPENVWLNNEDKSDFLRNVESKQSYDEYRDNDGSEYDSKRAPFWQRRPFNTQGLYNRPMQNQFGGNPFQNPYFMKNPNVRNPSSGVNRYGNAGTTNLGGQCTGLTSFPPEPNRGCCGRDVSDADRIIGGQTTEIDQFPWTVLLNSKFVNGRTQAEFSCGGSLISSRYVLTAAHCLYDAVARLSDVEIILAEYDKRTFPRDCMISPGEGRRCIDNIAMHAEDVILHPEYDDSRLQNDIALIRLRGTAPYTDFIRPICLPQINIDNPEFLNLPLSVAGWGRNGRYQSDVKQSTVVNLVPQRDCTRHYPHLTRRHLCAAGHTGEDTCKGDSGGPLMTLHRGNYFIAGIVSGKRADSPCGSAVPSLYTNVYNYLDWIRSNIKN